MMTLAELLAMAPQFGLRGVAGTVDYDALVQSVPLPCIAHWRGLHYVVVVSATEARAIVADPASGLHAFSREAFCGFWSGDPASPGIVTMFEPLGED